MKANLNNNLRDTPIGAGPQVHLHRDILSAFSACILKLCPGSLTLVDHHYKNANYELPVRDEDRQVRLDMNGDIAPCAVATLIRSNTLPQQRNGTCKRMFFFHHTFATHYGAIGIIRQSKRLSASSRQSNGTSAWTLRRNFPSPPHIPLPTH